MADNPPKQEPVTVLGLTFNLQKLRLPFYRTPLPDQTLRDIGQIAITWGAFENRLADLIVTLLSATGTTQKGQQFHSFEQKKNLAIDQAQLYFKYRPRIALRFIEIMRFASALQIKRNLLVHGNIMIKVPELNVMAVGRHKKQVITVEFTSGQVEDLSYDIGHLAGMMNDFMENDGMWSVRLSWQDRCFLQAFLSNSPPSHATEAMLPLPPPTSHQ